MIIYKKKKFQNINIFRKKVSENIMPSPNQFPWSTVEKIAANLLINGFHSGISFAYDSVNGRVNAIATGGGGGGGSTPPSLSITTQGASGSGELSYNSNSGVLTYTPPLLTGYAVKNASEAFSSLVVNTSISSASTLTNSITNLAGTGSPSFPNGLNITSLSVNGSSGNSGQYLTSTGTGVTWSTVSFVSENSSPTFSNASITGNLNVSGTITTNNLTTLNIQNNQVVLNDNVVGQPTSNANIIINRGLLPDTELRWNELSDRWEFTNDGTTYFNIPVPIDYNNYNNLLNRPTIPAAQVQSDWNATAGVSAILNKPTLFSGAYVDLTGKPTIPTLLQNLNNVSSAVPITGNILRWDGTQWAPASAGGSGVGGGSGTIIGPITSTDKAIARFNGINGLEVQNSLVTIGDDGAITAPKVKNLIPFYYSSLAELPSAAANAGAVAYTESGGALYYSHNSSWTNQRIVTTNSSTSSDLQTLIGNFQQTYSISTQDYTEGTIQQNAERKILRLSASGGANSDITIRATSGITISTVNNQLTLAGKVYNFSTETATGNQIKLRLQEIGVATTNTDITFAGADGLQIERTNATTITFRAPANTVTQYTDGLAKDAAALMLINGSKVGISYTYDSVNKVINTIVSGGGGGGGTVITYDFQGRNTTSNNAFLDLVPSTGLTDSVEIAGSAGTTVNWDSGNKRITIGSVAPVQSDWNQTNNASLDFIRNKPFIPSAYTLPIATASVLGGIKVGANLSINSVTGVLDANPGSYTLPTATASVLGGIKIGSGLTIDGNGVVNASVASSVPSIQDLSGITASLAPDATTELNITGYKAYSLFKITTTAEAWVRVYTDDASRDADATRSEGQDPLVGTGVISEIRTDGVTNTVLISPGILGFNNDNPRTTTIYLSVTNRSTSSTAITVTLTVLKIGE
jgi:hypothetical protein